MTSTDLLPIIYRYYPRGISQEDPRWKAAPQRQRLIEASLAAGRERPTWLSMLDRLRKRFPECTIYGDALHLLAPSSAAACYPGTLFLPATDADHRIGFEVSFLAPYYVLYSERFFPVERNIPPATRLAPDDSERPYWDAIAKEIETTYRAEYMPPEVGNVVVPDVQPADRLMGEAMIYDCFFDESPRLVSQDDEFGLELQKAYAEFIDKGT